MPKRTGLIRLLDGGEHLQQFVVAGISTVLITRAYLQLTGYPKIGGGGLASSGPSFRSPSTWPSTAW